MSHNPNNKECTLDYAFTDIGREQQTCTCTPKQDWEERFDKAFVAKGDTVFRSTVESDEVMSFISDLLFQAREEERERVVIELEEWAKSKAIQFVWIPTPSYGEKFFGCCSVCNALQDDPECPHQCEVQNRFCADLLAFADSLKKK